MIPAYNCIGFLPETIRCVLLQDLGEEVMQIEVIDDCSSDGDVQALVEELGKGRVKYYRQPQNVGSLRNFETCINRANGRLVHLLHGDDRVKDGFYKKMTELFEKFPQVGAGFCGYEIIDEQANYVGKEMVFADDDCILENWLIRIAEKQRLQYASMVVKREVYESLGSFYAVTYGEDWEMWARIASKYATAYTPLFLAEYRMHFDSISFGSYRSGKTLRDILTVLKIINNYLPEGQRKQLYHKALKSYIYWYCDFVGYIWYKTNNAKLVFAQLFKVLRVHRDLFVIKKCLRLVKLIGVSQLRYYKLIK